MNYQVTVTGVEITAQDINEINDLSNLVLDAIGRNNKENIVNISYKEEKIPITIRVHNDILYVLDKDYEKYMSADNKLFKAIFSNCATFERMHI